MIITYLLFFLNCRQEEETKRAEQAKRQAEALKRLQEQQQQAQARAAVKPSTTPAWTPPDTIATSTSLTEIQKTERKQVHCLIKYLITWLVLDPVFDVIFA